MKTLKQLFLVILITMLVMTEFFYISIRSFSTVITEKNINQTIEQVHLTDIMKEDYDHNPATPTKMDEIYEIAKKGNISTKTVDEFMNSNVMKKFTTLYAKQIKEYLTTGTVKDLTGDDLEKIVNESLDTMVNESGIPLPDSSKKAIQSVVKQHSDEIVSFLPTTSEVSEKIDVESRSMIEFLLSDQLKNVCLFIVMILIMLICIVTHSFYQFLFYHGIATGITTFFSFAMSHMLPNIISQSSLEEKTLAQNLLTVSSETISQSYLSLSTIFFAMTIFQLGLYFILTYFLNKRNLQKNVNQEIQEKE